MTATKTRPRNLAQAVRVGVIYVRISLDAAGDALGVARQERLCRELAKGLGIDVAHVISDNDVSAFQRRRRPGFERLMTMLEAGDVTDVFVYHADRLYRRLSDLERLVLLVEANAVQVHTSAAGMIDLTTASGRMVARMLGAAAQHESERTSERVTNQKREAADRGDVTSGQPPYGYRRVTTLVYPNKTANMLGIDGRRVTAFEVDENEAVALRFIVKSLTEGMSLGGVARALDAMGVPTRRGAGWSRQSVYKVGCNPASAGLRTYQGEVVGDAGWPGIISLADHEAVVRVLTDPRRKVRRPAEAYLLSSLTRNAVDGSRLYGQTETKGGEFYRHTYKSEPGRPSVCVSAADLDAHVEALVLDRSDEAALPKVADGNDGTATIKALAAVEADLVDLATERGTGAISRMEWEAMVVPMRARRDALASEVAALRGPSALASVLAGGDTLRKAWPTMSLEAKRATIGDLIEAINVGPVGRGKRVPITDRVPPEAIVWRV